MNTIRQRYNSHQHRVETLMADPEAINTSLQASLGANGIQIEFAYPSEHASCVERATRTINDHARATAAGLPYVLPPECQLLLGQSVCEALNNSVNKDTYCDSFLSQDLVLVLNVVGGIKIYRGSSIVKVRL